jgi:hypothetical protein
MTYPTMSERVGWERTTAAVATSSAVAATHIGVNARRWQPGLKTAAPVGQ